MVRERAKMLAIQSICYAKYEFKNVVPQLIQQAVYFPHVKGLGKAHLRSLMK